MAASLTTAGCHIFTSDKRRSFGSTLAMSSGRTTCLQSKCLFNTSPPKCGCCQPEEVSGQVPRQQANVRLADPVESPTCTHICHQNTSRCTGSDLLAFFPGGKPATVVDRGFSCFLQTFSRVLAGRLASAAEVVEAIADLEDALLECTFVTLVEQHL